jgi:hypothetical protein
MPGFDLYASRGTLVFEGTRYKGAEVRVKLDIPAAEFDEFVAYALLAEELAWMSEHAIESWNLEAKGEPLPFDGQSLAKMPRSFTRALVNGFIKAVVDIDAPLVSSSPSGDTPEAT